MGLTFTQTASDSANSTYTYSSTDINGINLDMVISGSFYDDSLGTTSMSNLFSADLNINNNQPRITTNMDISPGDYLKVTYQYFVSGQRVALTHQAGAQLATSMRVDKPDAGLDNGYDDYLIMIYDPDALGNFDKTGIEAFATNMDQYPYTGASHNPTVFNTGSALITGNPNFSEIESLTGETNTAYATFAAITGSSPQPAVTVDQKFAIRGQSTDINNYGYDFHIGNIGADPSDIITSGSRFNMTLGGAVNANTIPEPSAALFLGVAVFCSLFRRKK